MRLLLATLLTAIIGATGAHLASASSYPRAEVLNRRVIVDGHGQAKLNIRCEGENEPVCSGAVLLTAVPHNLGAGDVKVFGFSTKFTVRTGTERLITVRVNPLGMARLHELHHLDARARVEIQRGFLTSTNIILQRGRLRSVNARQASPIGGTL